LWDGDAAKLRNATANGISMSAVTSLGEEAHGEDTGAYADALPNHGVRPQRK